MKDEDILKRLGAAAEPEPLRLLGFQIREAQLRFGALLELEEIADRPGLSRWTLREKKKKWGL